MVKFHGELNDDGPEAQKQFNCFLDLIVFLKISRQIERVTFFSEFRFLRFEIFQ